MKERITPTWYLPDLHTRIMETAAAIESSEKCDRILVKRLEMLCFIEEHIMYVPPTANKFFKHEE